MKIKILIIFAIAILLGCSGNKSKHTPQNLIPKDKLIAVLVDMHFSDAILIDQKLYDKELKEGSYYTFLLQKHGITMKQFTETIEYYTSKPEAYAELYTHVFAELSRRRGELNADSIPEK